MKKFWRNTNLTSAALTPFSWLYRLGAWWDRTRTTPTRVPLPVVSIGNATVGGSGKTPLTHALVPILTAAGYTPHIMTRGYKGEQLRAHRVRFADDPRLVGDEPLLLAAAAPTWVGADRLASATAAITAGATILVCDDALQHHALHKDINILVIDGPFGIGNGMLLPAGPLREPFATALARCHAAILVGEDAQNLASRITIPTFRAQLKPAADTSFLQQAKWFAFAGIGRPEKFYDTLRSIGADVVGTRNFPDHHPYTNADIAALLAQAKAMGATLITTAKDDVKIPPQHRTTIRVLPISLALEDPGTFNQFLTQKLSALKA